MDKKYDLLMNYRFRVLLDNQVVSFSKVSGLQAEVETELLSEGGYNGCGHIMETPVKHPKTLRMEGGIFQSGNHRTLMKLRPGMYLKQGIVVMVLGAGGDIQAQYCAEQAVVTKWELAELNAENGSVLVNIFEAVYAQLKMGK